MVKITYELVLIITNKQSTIYFFINNQRYTYKIAKNIFINNSNPSQHSQNAMNQTKLFNYLLQQQSTIFSQQIFLPR